MKGDFSRLTFDVTKHFRRVLMQQGRVQLDADWNEQTAILLHYLQSLAKDLIGEYGGPADITDSVNGNVLKRNLGFEIIVEASRVDKFSELDTDQKNALKTLISGGKPPIAIGKGHYYVDGILCEIGDDTSFSKQSDYPWPKDKNLAKGNFLVYADVWERHITYVEDDSIREVALGGPDTATRAKLVWQVKVTNKYWKKVNGEYTDDDIPANQGDWRTWVSLNWSGWLDHWQPQNRGWLKAQAKQDPKKDSDPCITSPEASYRGTENQLYRVEIHKDGIAWDGKKETKDNAATFKWSRDNGRVATRVKLDGTELTVDNPIGLSAGQWVELTNEGQELRGEVGTLVKIKKIDCDILFLDVTNMPAPIDNLPNGEDWPTKARLWESDEKVITESSQDWITLADGVQIQFQPSIPENQYRTGDYWLIPTRVATGDVEWPGTEGNPQALPPFGVEHHYAPLAIIKSGGETIDLLQDLRHQIVPLGKPIP
ncbi:MAG: DUF6519 domain-containing protein [Methylobacter sp.]